jgi:hypothetical protein
VFSVKKTSAGDRAPSCSICCASTSSSSLLTLTVTPVCVSNACTSASVVCSCCPLYKVIVWPASGDAAWPAAGDVDVLPAPFAQAAMSRVTAVAAVTGIHLVSLIPPHLTFG